MLLLAAPGCSWLLSWLLLAALVPIAWGTECSTKIMVPIAWGTEYSTKIVVPIAWGTEYSI